jgi:hypothetical protein
MMANLRNHAAHDLVLAQSNGCKKIASTSQTRRFGIERCDSRHLNDEKHFVQVKPHYGFNQIYCPKRFITIDERMEFCPEDVFVLPITASFQINNVAYIGSKLQIDRVETIDTWFTMRANGHFQPRINLADLMQDPLVDENKSITDGGEATLIKHPMKWSAIGTHPEHFEFVYPIV